MHKKAQVSLYIIIGIIFIVLIILFFSFRSSLNFGGEKEVILSFEAQEVKSIVETCIEEAMANTIFINSLQGGYYEEPENSFEYPYEDLFFTTAIPYYAMNGKINYPEKKELLDQISLGIKSELFGCLDFSDLPYEVEYSKELIEVEADIANLEVSSKISFPINIIKGEAVASLNKFSAKIKSNYSDFYDFAVRLTEEQKGRDEICVSCIGELSYNYEIGVATLDLADDKDYIVVYYLTKDGSDEVFVFAHQYDLEENL